MTKYKSYVHSQLYGDGIVRQGFVHTVWFYTGTATNARQMDAHFRQFETGCHRDVGEAYAELLRFFSEDYRQQR